MYFQVKGFGHPAHYNVRVRAATAQRLLDLNRLFYAERGADFSATRQRLQPGVQRILKTLRDDESILDLGCGNGELARALSRRGHHSSYLGLDFSGPLLAEARREVFLFPVEFLQFDLVQLKLPSHSPRAMTQAAPSSAGGTRAAIGPALAPDAEGWSIVTAFAVLHHIPGHDMRKELLSQVHEQLRPDGKFILSNWQFLHSPRLRAHVQPWDTIGLTIGDLDLNDYLLDWRAGGKGLRYVHHFDEAELAGLAAASGFEVHESFYSDGADRRTGLYQVLRKVGSRRALIS